jgi:hypothetical protein
MIPHDNADVSNDDIFKILAGELLPSDIHRRREEAERNRRQAQVKDELMEFYKVLNTRHLLVEYRQTRRLYADYYYDPSPRNFPVVVKLGVPKQFHSPNGIVPYQETVLEAIKAVLATREHIPRGRLARQLRAKERKGQGKSKNR